MTPIMLWEMDIWSFWYILIIESSGVIFAIPQIEACDLGIPVGNSSSPSWKGQTGQSRRGELAVQMFCS